MGDAADDLRTISDGTRFSILAILLRHDVCSGALARRLGISEAAVSQHMRVLRDAGLVTPVRRGYFTHYEVDRDRIRALAEVLLDMSEAERLPCDPLLEGCERRGRGRCRTGEPGVGCPVVASGGARCPGCRRCARDGGSEVMRVAATYEDGEVFQHFGRTQQFKVYDVEDGKVVSSQVQGTGGKGHGELVGVLRSLGVSALICGGLGGGAMQGLEASGIRVVPGCSGDADAAVQAFLEGRLEGPAGPTCDHHGEGHACSCGRHRSSVERDRVPSAAALAEAPAGVLVAVHDVLRDGRPDEPEGGVEVTLAHLGRPRVLAVRRQSRLPAEGREVRAGVPVRGGRHRRQVHPVQGHPAGVDLQDAEPGGLVRLADEHEPVEPPRPQEGRVDHVGAVGRTHDGHVAHALDAVHGR